MTNLGCGFREAHQALIDAIQSGDEQWAYDLTLVVCAFARLLRRLASDPGLNYVPYLGD